MEPLPDCLDALPLHRAVVERFAEHLAPLPGVEAAFVSGSIGRNEATAHSDVDLVLVFGDERQRLDHLSRAGELFAEMGEVLTCTHALHVKPSLWLAVMRGPVLVDLDFTDWSMHEPGPWHREMLIVKDRDDSLATIRDASHGIGTAYTAEWLARLSERWWRWMFYCAKDNRRGDHLLVHGNFDFLRSNAFSHLFAVIEGAPREYAGRYRDLDRPARLARILADTGDARQSWDRTLLRLHGYFKELRNEVQTIIPHLVPANEAAIEAELAAYLAS